MSKFCGNCGATLDDAAVVCGYCGAPLANTPNNKQSKINGAGFASVAKELTSNKIFKIAAPAALGLIVIIIVAAIVIPSVTGYKAAIKDFAKAYEQMDSDKLIELSCDLATQGQDDDCIETLDEDLKAHFEHVEEELDSAYEIKYEILSEDKLTEAQLNKYKDMYNDLDLNADGLKKAVKVKIRFTYSYDTRSKTHTSNFIIFKENGDWKFYNVDQYKKTDTDKKGKPAYNYKVNCYEIEIFD